MSVKKLFDQKPTQPNAALKDEFASGGISFLDQLTLKEIILAETGIAESDVKDAYKSFVTVEIDLAVPEDYQTPPNFSVKARNIQTGRDVYFTSFMLHRIGEQNVLCFSANMFIPSRVVGATPDREQVNGVLGLSFQDLCFGGAGELTSTDTDTLTPRREGVGYADIGWVLNSRFTDTLIDALGRLNDTLFDGGLRESMIYTRI